MKEILEVIYELFIGLIGNEDEVPEDVVNLLAKLRGMIDELESVETNNNSESN